MLGQVHDSRCLSAGHLSCYPAASEPPKSPSERQKRAAHKRPPPLAATTAQGAQHRATATRSAARSLALKRVERVVGLGGRHWVLRVLHILHLRHIAGRLVVGDLLESIFVHLLKDKRKLCTS